MYITYFLNIKTVLNINQNSILDALISPDKGN